MEFIILAVFVLGYVFIALEHTFHIDKAASALLTGTVCWGLFVLGTDAPAEHLTEAFKVFSSEHVDCHVPLLSGFFEHLLLHHMEEISSILFFLMGAMTIVELVDAHEGFAVITDRIRTTNKVRLLWTLALLTFFF